MKDLKRQIKKAIIIIDAQNMIFNKHNQHDQRTNRVVTDN